MKYDWIDAYLLAKKGVQKDFKAEWNWLRYMVGDKLFAAVCYDDKTNRPALITLKLTPNEGDFLPPERRSIPAGFFCPRAKTVLLHHAGLLFPPSS